MIQAVIFDMDGLLIDSEPYWRNAHVSTMKAHGHTITEQEARDRAGIRTADTAQYWIDRFSIKGVTAQELTDQMVSNIIKSIQTEGKPQPGVAHVLGLFNKYHIPMAIASSAEPKMIDAVMRRLELRSHMQVIYSAVHEPKGKPDPGVFLTTAKKLGVDPADCLVFEDAVSGVQAAKAAGMKCIAVPETANRNKPEFQQADIVLDSLGEVTIDMVYNL